MLLFYSGTDAYRIREAVLELADRYRAKHGRTNLFTLDATHPDERTILDGALKHQSFFREPTFVAAARVFDDQKARTHMHDLLEETTILDDKEVVLLVHQQGSEAQLKKKGKKLWDALAKKAKTHRQFDALTGRKLAAWMQSFCTERSCTLGGAEASRIVALVGAESWALSNELAKLCAWTGSGPIASATIDRLTTAQRPDADIFVLTDAVAHRNKRAILTSLDHQLQAGADPHYVLSMYAFAVRNLLIVKDLSEQGMDTARIAQAGGLHPFVVKKALSGAKAFTTQELVSAHSWLARADKYTKDGLWDPHDTLFDFVLTAL